MRYCCNRCCTDNYALLHELYERRASLPASDFFLAAALGDVATVESMLAAEPGWASRVGGPRQTPAITYAAFARFSLVDGSYPARQQQVVSLLLSHGADSNAFAREELRGKDSAGRLSALYGCCRYPGNPAIAELLLDAGASTDDGESLYPHLNCAIRLVSSCCLPRACLSPVESSVFVERWITNIPMPLRCISRMARILIILPGLVQGAKSSNHRAARRTWRRSEQAE